MNDRYSIPLLKNQYLELRQIRLKSGNRPIGYHLIPKARFRICSLSVRLPIPTIFFNLYAWLSCIPDKVHPLGTLKQMKRRALWCHILTGRASQHTNDLPRYPHRVRPNRQVARGKQHRDPVGRSDDERLVGRTCRLGSTTQMVNAKTVSEPDIATICHKAAARPGEPRIANPLLARRRRFKRSEGKDSGQPIKRARKGARKGARGGGGRARPGRRRRDRSDPLGKIFTNSRTSRAPDGGVQAGDVGGEASVGEDGMDRGGVKEEGCGGEPGSSEEAMGRGDGSAG